MFFFFLDSYVNIVNTFYLNMQVVGMQKKKNVLNTRIFNIELLYLIAEVFNTVVDYNYSYNYLIKEKGGTFSRHPSFTRRRHFDRGGV